MVSNKSKRVRSKYSTHKSRKNTLSRKSSSHHETTINIIDMLMKLKHTIKLYHWTTDEYRIHITTDGYLKQLDPLIDQYVEVMLGLEKKYEKKNKEVERKLKQVLCDIQITPLDTVEDLNHLLNSVTQKLKQHDKISNDPELLAIRDEILSETQKFKYLIAFKE